jgi:siderophore synthetase component
VIGAVTDVPGAPVDAATVAVALAEAAPELLPAYRAALPLAAQSVGRRLLGALCREDIGDSRQRYADAGARHGFDRVEFATAPAGHPVTLLPASLAGGQGGGAGLVAELSDAVVNLAIAYARHGRLPAAPATALLGPHGAGPAHTSPFDADERALRAERLAVDGHNLHPCGRTRLGWRPADVLRHDMEAGTVRIGFVAIRRDLHRGDDLGALLHDAYPDIPTAPPGFVLQPVHEWQLAAVLRRRHRDLVRDGALRPIDGWLPGAPTAALRTLLLPPGADGLRRYLKVSLDIQVTSTRRTISVASTSNGPAVTDLLRRLLGADRAGARVLLLPEVAGAAALAGTGRDVSAIVRGGLDDRLGAGEVAVPGGALTTAPSTGGVGGTVLSELLRRYADTRGVPEPAAAALAFVGEYARLLLTPVLRLSTRYGVGLEAHLQNCLPTFVAGVPHRIVFRDFAGLRIHRPRLAAAGEAVALWPGSVIDTDDIAVMRAKVCYTALQANLGELVVRLAGTHGLDEPAAWRRVREVLDEVFDPLRADPTSAAAAAADHAALTAPYVPHKALVRMRLAGGGDLYLPVRNPLHAP